MPAWLWRPHYNVKRGVDAFHDTTNLNQLRVQAKHLLGLLWWQHWLWWTHIFFSPLFIPLYRTMSSFVREDEQMQFINSSLSPCWFFLFINYQLIHLLKRCELSSFCKPVRICCLPLTWGVPQGSILGHNLCSIYMLSIAFNLRKFNISFFSFLCRWH